MYVCILLDIQACFFAGGDRKEFSDRGGYTPKYGVIEVNVLSNLHE